MDEKNVSCTRPDRALARAVVEMAINDIVAIESVRLARRLKATAELIRAGKRRGRPSLDREARAMRFVLRAAQPKSKRARRRHTLPLTEPFSP